MMTTDYFTYQPESDAFPGDGASPYVDYQCKLCGYKFSNREFGSFFEGEPRPQDIAIDRIEKHLHNCHPEIYGGTSKKTRTPTGVTIAATAFIAGMATHMLLSQCRR